MRADTKTISIHAKADEVMDFLADPKNLPRWAVGFAKSVRPDGDRWIVTTGGGEIGIRIVAERSLGVLDFYMCPAPTPRHAGRGVRKERAGPRARADGAEGIARDRMPAMTERSATAETLASAVDAARAGDRESLERIVRAVQDDIFRLAMRMTGCPEDARDACQEILIKVVTRLDSFRGDASVRTWAYRIAVRHLLDRKKSRVEELAMSFERFGSDLLDGLVAPESPDPIMVEEVKLGCTLAMLTCLDREHRLAYVLGDVFDLSHRDAAEICAIAEDAYRQRLSRARRYLETFTETFCGLVNERAPCRCDKRVARAEALGRITRGKPRLAHTDAQAATREMESLFETARLMRAHPAYAAPADVMAGVRAALRGGRSRILG